MEPLAEASDASAFQLDSPPPRDPPSPWVFPQEHRLTTPSTQVGWKGIYLRPTHMFVLSLHLIAPHSRSTSQAKVAGIPPTQGAMSRSGPQAHCPDCHRFTQVP